MSLFTDSNLVSPSLLLSMDPEVSAVLDALGKKGAPTVTLDSILFRAWSECRSKLESALASFNVYIGQAGMQSHIAAVLNTGWWYGSGTRARLRLDQIVASDTYYANSISPLQNWVAYTALRIVFQTASLHFAGKDGKEDRYARKEERYDKQAGRIWAQIRAQGLPFVASPLCCPGAVHGWNAGTWDANNLSLSVDPSSTNAADQEIRVAITYVDQDQYISPTNKNNSESGPSVILDTILPANQLLTVDISSLNPPGLNNVPEVGLSQGTVTYMRATGWQCYIGGPLEGSPLFLQNSTPIPISQKQYAVPAALVFSGYAMTNGQVPDPQSNLIFGNVLARG